jgi:hypothetical protein
MIILEDITTLLDSKTADFVGWTGKDGLSKIAGGIWLLTTGTHSEAWDRFDPTTSPARAYAAGHRGSDQAWLSYCLYPPQECWTKRDGVYKLGWLSHGGRCPSPEVKIVFMNGLRPPWDASVQLGHTWFKDHWHL